MGYCHVMSKKVARGIAEAFYETAAHDDSFYRLHPSVGRFTRVHWQNFVDPARTTLASMLGRPDVADTDKAKIHEALLLDHSAPRGGKHRVIDLH
jgi:hypothetical protein